MQYIKELVLRGRLRNRLRLWSFLLMTIPLVLFTMLHIVYEAERTKKQQLQSLQLILRTQQKAIDNWFDERAADVKEISNWRSLKSGVRLGTEDRFRTYLETKKEFNNILYVDKAGFVRLNPRAPLVEESIADREYFKRNQQGLDATSELLYGRGANPGTPIIVFSSPILSEKSDFSGAIVGTVRIDTISHMMQEYRFGKTGETYLVGQDGTMLTESMFDNELIEHGLVKKSAKLELKIDTEGLRRAKEEKSGTAIYYDFRGKRVLGAYQWLENRRLVILAEIDEDEVMAPFYRQMLLMSLALGVFLIIGYHLTNRWARTVEKPLSELVGAVGAVEQGGYGVQLDESQFENAPIEFRQLRHSFNQMSMTIKTTNEKLLEMSYADGLTGIANRRYFDLYLQQEWSRCARTAKPISLLLIDIDFFKGYNDTYGHIQGDDCLRIVAQTLKQTPRRPGDLVARFGGEEFIIILSDTNEIGAVNVAEKVLSNIEGLKLPHETSRINPYVTVSVGIASICPTNQLSTECIVQAADSALYKAKQGGRNRYEVYC